MPFLKGRTDPFEIQAEPALRPHVFELMDCHGEHVRATRRIPSGAPALR